MSSIRRRLDWDLLNVIRGAITLVLDPQQTQSVYDVEDGLRHHRATALAVEFVKQHSEVAAIFADRYLAKSPDLAALAQLPAGSLGNLYAVYLDESGFDANFYRLITVEDDASYFLMRMRQTHDIWHLVAGFGTDVPGELGLKAFELAQTRRPLSAVLLSGGVLSAVFKAPESIGALLEQIAIGYRLGATAEPFLAQRWEDHWDRPLDDWRRQLNFQPMTHYQP
ncbi:MAG: Coq4 family protein [Cyanobacteria bacterium P01_C01_bin.120]